MKKRKKPLSKRELERRHRQQQASCGHVYLHTPDGDLLAMPKRGGYLLTQHNRNPHEP